MQARGSYQNEVASFKEKTPRYPSCHPQEVIHPLDCRTGADRGRLWQVVSSSWWPRAVCVVVGDTQESVYTVASTSPSKQRRHWLCSGWLLPRAASVSSPSLLSSWLPACSPSRCVVSGWGLDKDVAPGLLCLLDYVGVFPTREICAPLSSPLKENAQDSGVSLRYG